MTEDRTVTVPPERIDRWLSGFADRHPGVQVRWSSDTVEMTSPDGAQAILTVPFPPLPPPGPDQDDAAALRAHLTRPRTVAALLVRRGGVAVGVFEGVDLVASKVETSYVQGKTKAGGWSQQRYARRRDQQARALTDTATDLAVRLLLPRAGDMAGLVRGGDATLLATVLDDPRLAPLAARATARILPVPDPRLRVLAALPDQFRAVSVRLNALA